MKKAMKRQAAVLMAAVFLMSAGGCTQKKNVETSTETVQKETEVADEMNSEGFVLLSDVAPDVIQEVRYYTTYNFVGERIDGYEEPCVLMTKEAAAALNDPRCRAALGH